jgi:hypothetical protein
MGQWGMEREPPGPQPPTIRNRDGYSIGGVEGGFNGSPAVGGAALGCIDIQLAPMARP